MTMTPDRFLESVVEAYRRAREPIQSHDKISRGESRAIASETEDLFAYYLINRSLEPGKLADLVILDKNPLKVDPMTLRDIKVIETIKEGKTIYKAP